MAASPAPPDAAKRALRRSIRESRASLPSPDRDRMALGLRDVVLAAPALTSARCVTLFASTVTEPGTWPLRLALRSVGVRVLLPVVPVRLALPLDWADDGPSLPGRHDIDEPTGRRWGVGAASGASVMLVPALAVDTSGHRLGQGGGYYDATLAALPDGPGRPLVVALVYDDEVLAAGSVPSAAHDRVVDAVATPSRWLDLRPASGRAR